MKRLVIAIILICIFTTSCTTSPTEEKAIDTNAASKTVRFIGRFMENISAYSDFQDRIMIQAEQGESFDVYSLDMKSPSLKYEYRTQPQENLLYLKQFGEESVLKVKQLGNGEENNIMVLEGKVPRNIAKRIAYSDVALVSVSPNQKYIVYCAAEDIQNRYGLYLYDMETEKSLQLVQAIDEDLLNDMEWNISWSPDNQYMVVSHKLIFQVASGKLIKEINADHIVWSNSSAKLAFTRQEQGLGKAVCVLDISSTEFEEVFLVNQGEYLPGYLVWNDAETKLAFVIADVTLAEALEAAVYKAIYSLDINSKEAVRIDSELQMMQTEVARLESMQYNADGSVLALVTENFSGHDLYVCNLNTGDSSFFTNIEYLHHENNERYVCSAQQNLYFVQNQSIIRLEGSLNSKKIYQSQAAIEDIYISRDGSSMIIVESSEKGTVLRQLKHFANHNI